MILLRSFVFNVLLYAWTASIAVAMLPLLAAPASWVNAGAKTWVRGSMLLARLVVGLDYEVRGHKNLPHDAAVVASKHQSMWETLVFHVILDRPIYVLKKELTRIPVFGWLLLRAGSVAVDRSAGTRAMKKMMTETKAALANGHQVVIFPEGTRTAVGTEKDYQPGVSMLYGLGGRVVPVALNSGLFWARHSFRRYPGTILVEFLEPMPEGLDRRTFVSELQGRIEAATQRLVAEAQDARTRPTATLRQ